MVSSEADYKWRSLPICGIDERKTCFLGCTEPKKLLKISTCSSAADLRTLLSQWRVFRAKNTVNYEYETCEIREFIDLYDDHHALYHDENHLSADCRECIMLYCMLNLITAKARMTTCQRYLDVTTGDIGDMLKKIRLMAPMNKDAYRWYFYVEEQLSAIKRD